MEIGLVDLLRAAWLAATLPILVASIPSSHLNSFRELVLGFAKRGKIMQSSSNVRPFIFFPPPLSLYMDIDVDIHVCIHMCVCVCVVYSSVCGYLES